MSVDHNGSDYNDCCCVGNEECTQDSRSRIILKCTIVVHALACHKRNILILGHFEAFVYNNNNKCTSALLIGASVNEINLMN